MAPIPGGFSGIILCGGAGSRLGGSNKAFLQLGSRCFLDLLLETLAPLVDRVLLVARNPEAFRDYPVRTVADIHSARCAMTGIHAGLTHCPTSHAFVTACDAPLLKKELARGLMQQASRDTDAVVPQYNGYLEPLCAVYSRQSLPAIEEMLQNGTYRIRMLYPLIRTRTVDKDFIRFLDPNMDSFFNVNTERDLQELTHRDETRGISGEG